MALASLRFQRNTQDYENSRQAMIVFAGDAASFHEWQFRLKIKKSLCKADELPALTAKVVDALRGEVLSCAVEVGLAKLMEANGLDLLVQKVQERLFPQRTAEARELLKQGMRIGGPTSCGVELSPHRDRTNFRDTNRVNIPMPDDCISACAFAQEVVHAIVEIHVLAESNRLSIEPSVSGVQAASISQVPGRVQQSERTQLLCGVLPRRRLRSGRCRARHKINGKARRAV